MESVADIEQRIESARRTFAEVKAEMARVIVGHEALIEQVFIALVCGGHCLLEGVPGLGKTLMVRSLGEILSLSFSRVQFTPDLMPADITGTNMLTDDPSGERFLSFSAVRCSPISCSPTRSTAPRPRRSRRCWKRCRSKASPSAASCIVLESPFMVLATQNPIEMEGTYPLPEAQVDRFFFKLLLEYPKPCGA